MHWHKRVRTFNSIQNHPMTYYVNSTSSITMLIVSGGLFYLAESGLVVQPGAAIAMATSTNFKVERTVDPETKIRWKRLKQQQQKRPKSNALAA